MDIATLDISEFANFKRHIERLRQQEYPYDKFLMMVLHLPRWLAIEHLRESTFHPDPEVYCEALDLLSRLSPIDSCPRCFELLSDEDARVRQVALDCLKIMGIRCETSILRVLKTEKDGNVRRACVEALSWIGSARSVGILREIKETDKSVDYEGRPINDVAEGAIKRIEANFREL
jgi:HEAT repeat protein